jgi:hypothetical protein
MAWEINRWRYKENPMGEEKSIYHLAATGEMEKILASPSASN